MPEENIGVVKTQPQNVNFLATHRFRVILKRAPNIAYFCQEANLPGLAMGTATQPTPFTDIPHPGDKIHFEDFTISFPIDEDMKNYKEIDNWIIGLGFPKQYGQYVDLQEGEGTRSDITLMILDSNHNPMHSVSFRDAFPISLSGINFDVKASDTAVAIATATFKYTYYEFDEVNLDTETLTPADR